MPLKGARGLPSTQGISETKQPRESHTNRLTTSIAGVGIVGILSAVSVLLFTPVETYHPSIFDAVHPAVLIILVATYVIIFLTGTHLAERQWAVGYFILNSIFTILVSLPLLAGFFYYGTGDSLTHLGYTKLIENGNYNPLQMLYPGIHVLAVALSDVLKISPRSSLYVATSGILFCYGLTLAALGKRLFPRSSRSPLVFLAAGHMLLPVNWIAIHAYVHPVSFAVLFSASAFLAIFVLLDGPTLAKYSVVLIIALGITLLHPQAAFIMAVGIAGSGITFLILRRTSRTAGHPAWTSLGLSVVFSGITWLRIRNVPSLEGGILGVFNSLIRMDSAILVASRTASIGGVGGSILQVALILFLLPAIFLFSSGYYFFKSLVLNPGQQSPGKISSIAPPILLGFITPLSIVIVLSIFVSSNDIYFRYIGALMIPTTIAGASGLVYLSHSLRRSKKSNRPAGHPEENFIPTIMVFMILFSILHYYPSPMIYKDSAQVTSSYMEGYSWVFTHNNPQNIQHLRIPHYRFSHALGISSDFSSTPNPIPFHFSKEENQDGWVTSSSIPVTTTDKYLETELYEGFRWSNKDFIWFQGSNHSARIYSNGNLDVYKVTKV